MREEQGLFRPEAIAGRAMRLNGKIVITTPPSIAILGTLLWSITFAALLFACVVNFTHKETVDGWLTPQDGLIRSLTRQGGFVMELFVQEGSDVRAGDRIAAIRVAESVESGDPGLLQLQSVKDQEIATQNARKAAQQELHMQLDSLKEHRHLSLIEFASEKRNIELVKVKIELAETNVDRFRELVAQGFASTSNLEAAQQQLVSAQQEDLVAQQKMLEAEQQASEFAEQIEDIPRQIRESDAKFDNELAALASKRVAAEHGSETFVTSPVAGHIVALPAQIGQPVGIGNVVAVIAPVSSPLIAELFIPAQAIGFVAPGDSVKLMYDGYPHEKFGFASGVLKSITQAPLAPNETIGPGADQKTLIYRACVALDQQSFQAYGRNYDLRPGMTLKADIVVDHSTLMQMLLEPLIAAGKR